MNFPPLDKMLALFTLAENLKKELRHSWLSNGRQESVAEHSWRLAFMLLIIAPYLKIPISLERGLMMAIVHDLAEAVVGDIPVFECTTAAAKAQKHTAEQQGLQQLCALLNDATSRDILSVWEEYERGETPLAKVVKALDKLEVFLQHNEASLATWLHREKLMVFQKKWKDVYCECDPILKALSDLVNEQAIEKLRAAGCDIEALRNEAEKEISG